MAIFGKKRLSDLKKPVPDWKTTDLKKARQWLESIGFTEVDTKHRCIVDGNLEPEYSMATREMGKHRGFYITGSFDPSNPGTRWIQFGDARKVFFVRLTEDMTKTRGLSKLEILPTKKSKETLYFTVGEFNREVEEFLISTE